MQHSRGLEGRGSAAAPAQAPSIHATAAAVTVASGAAVQHRCCIAALQGGVNHWHCTALFALFRCPKLRHVLHAHRLHCPWHVAARCVAAWTSTIREFDRPEGFMCAAAASGIPAALLGAVPWFVRVCRIGWDPLCGVRACPPHSRCLFPRLAGVRSAWPLVPLLQDSATGLVPCTVVQPVTGLLVHWQHRCITRNPLAVREPVPACTCTAFPVHAPHCARVQHRINTALHKRCGSARVGPCMYISSLHRTGPPRPHCPLPLDAG